MKQIISALFLCMLLSAVPGLQAQNIQLHYDFGRSLYDKDLQGRPLLTSTVEKFHPDTWGSTYFFVDMDYTSEGVAAAYWEIAREVKFWKGPFSAHLEYNGGLSKGMSYKNAYLAGATYTFNNASFSKGFTLTAMYKYIQKHSSPNNFQLTGTWYVNFCRNLLTFSGFADWWREETMLDLIKEVHKVEGIERIRLGSLEPGIITEEFAKELSEMPKVCPHFHLSLQSGCDATLKRMNRKYTSGEYYDRCQILRKYFDHPALTTDVIVGFPGETEEEFEASYAFVDRVDFYETHIFKYSKREGTKAAVMDGQIDEKIKGERSARMIALGERKKKAYEDSFIGKEVEVLFEERAQIEGKAVMTGHTKEYMKIALETEKNISNCIVKVRIENHSQIIR